MTNNEQIAYLLLEAAELLKEDTYNNYNDDYDSLNEGIGTILGLSAVGLVSVSFLYCKIRDALNIKKKGKKMTPAKEYIDRDGLTCELNNVLDRAKFVSYKKNLADVFVTNTRIINKYNALLKKLDNELQNIKTPEEFYSKKQKFVLEYKKIYTSVNKELHDSNKKLENSEWYENDNPSEIIKSCKKYLDLSDNYFRNIDGDDFWEGCAIFTKQYMLESTREQVGRLSEDIYNVLTTFPESSICELSGYTEPLKYIKIQLTGKTKKED